ncbi:hypothetical protein U0070_019904 [Myodes glareolus]|uniref:TatD DNase domain containing 3 n=1 Tax=Myodes glareolus TaxID=447135 RepID=A0AAW0JKQ7_MYOGA
MAVGTVGSGLVDCHCHLSAPDFNSDLDDVLEKAKKDLDVALPIIEKYKDRLLAIGEVGLDFTPKFAGTDEEKEEQRQVLIRQVQLAKRLNVPFLLSLLSKKQKLVKQLPLSSICLETDSPALGPEKLTRNEPCNISISAEFIAQVKGISVEEVQEVTTQNALKLFPKLQDLLQK